MSKKTKVEISYGSYFGNNYNVVIQNGGLTYLFGHGPGPMMDHKMEVQLSNEEIGKFLTTLTRITRDWSKEYTNPEGITDGIGWSVRIFSQALSYNFEGYAEFPPNWRSFVKAVRALVGIKQFCG